MEQDQKSIPLPDLPGEDLDVVVLLQLVADGSDLEADLLSNFRVAVTESLGWATIAAFIAAVSVSVFVSRRIVAPIQRMMTASQRIADGHYDERVDLPGGNIGVEEAAMCIHILEKW